ncbi:MAG TPA: hypothetical protein VM121_09495 [Acidimicrobiales bacterium]|nr:hypothetical protein [Acidimicrobiales bacterium]
MNFPSAHQPDDPSNHEFEVILEDGIKPESESPAKPATAILVIIPRGIGFKVDVDSYPGAICVKIPVGEKR